MSGERIELAQPGGAGVRVRTIVEEDIELLRAWKNAYRDRFFFQEIITPEMQKAWFRSYLERAHDFMFVVLDGAGRVGCLGFRRREDRVDFYNVIVDPRSARRGHMSRALELLCGEARLRYPGAPLMVSVLRTNPDLDWYLRRGFTPASDHEDHVDLIRSER